MKNYEQEISKMQIGEMYEHPFHHIPMGVALFKILSIRNDPTTRFGHYDRIADGEIYLANRDGVKFLEKDIIWLGSLIK
jgi:hypothetical protein